ncbi:hypothetical protein C8J57DRAFT_1212294 [Mycena rebaudengoi]|nr:hypothetical protein C8J57DRAFT_1212294 [Mycena rebaudengoi]
MARPRKDKQAKRENAAKAAAARRKKPDTASVSPPADNAAQPTAVSDAQRGPNTSLGEGHAQEIEWDSLLGHELPDTECTEFQPSLGDEEDTEIATESDLDVFSKFLADAQIAAQAAERRRERETGRKRIRGAYTGNSNQTKWRNATKKRKLAANGFLGLAEFFTVKKAPEGSSMQPQTDGEGEEQPENKLGNEGEASGDEHEASGDEGEALEIEEMTAPAPTAPQSSNETCMDPVNLAHVQLKALLEAISSDLLPSDNSPESRSEIPFSERQTG